jgi:hypothetical protein
MGRLATNSSFEPAENDFVFSVFLMALRDAWKGPTSDEELVNLLYGFVWEPADLLNRKGDVVYCDATTASRLRNRKTNVASEIKDHCFDDAVVESLPASFQKSVVPRLQESKTDLLIEQLTGALRNSRCSAAFVEKACDMAVSEPLSRFLAVCLQESLTWPNKIEAASTARKEKPLPAGARKPYDDPRSPEIPEDIKPSELPYVSALMDVYAEEDGVESLIPEDLDGNARRKRHFTRQREDYYNAEFVRRCMRDTYATEADDRFEDLENEAYTGVVEVYDRDYENGKARLSNVLDRAVTLDFAKCWIRRNTDWLGNSEKKGLCHVLVNDERIKGWCDADIQQ